MPQRSSRKSYQRRAGPSVLDPKRKLRNLQSEAPYKSVQSRLDPKQKTAELGQERRLMHRAAPR